MKSEICQRFFKNFPTLCEDPVDTELSLRGNFITSNGNYYIQFWSFFPGVHDNYLSCGECYEIEITKEDGSLYPKDERRSENIIAQIVDSAHVLLMQSGVVDQVMTTVIKLNLNMVVLSLKIVYILIYLTLLWLVYKSMLQMVD